MSEHKKGDVVEEAGKYVCVPCGFHHEYKEGDTFGECTSCLTGSNNNSTDDEDSVEGTGIWEKESPKSKSEVI